MKTRTILIVAAMLIMLPNISNAQFGAVRRAINRQIDHKIDSSISQSAQNERDKKAQEEAAQGTDNNAGQGSSGSGKSTGLFGGKIDTKYKDNYDFTGRIYMQMETHNKKDVFTSDMYTYFNENNLDAGVDMKTPDPENKGNMVNTQFIIDHDNRAFLTLLNMQSKTGTISALPSDSALAAQAKANASKQKPPVVTKTGNSRTIAGYKCDEYKVIDPDKAGYAMVWMTKDLKIKADTKNWGRTGTPSYYDYPGFEGMVMLAMEQFDKDNDLALKMETIEIDEHFKFSMSTVGYKFMKMNIGMGRSGKK